MGQVTVWNSICGFFVLGSVAIVTVVWLDHENTLDSDAQKLATTAFFSGVPVYNYHLRNQNLKTSRRLRLLSGEDPVSDWVLVLRSDHSDDDHVHDICNGGHCVGEGHPSEGGVGFVTVRATERELETLLSMKGDSIAFAEPDAPMFADAVPWGLDRIDARSALDGEYSCSPSGGTGVHVYVADTGVRSTHVEFVKPNGASRVVPTIEVLGAGVVVCAVDDADCASDGNGHGTHVAGTIGGLQYGVAKNVTMHAVKVLTNSGSGQWSWFIQALDWVATHGTRPAVFSASLGSSGVLNSIKVAVDAAVAAGVTVVVAAGNSNSDACGFTPGHVPSAVVVGATGSDDSMASFSNYGSCVDIFAPGKDIMSASHSDDSSARSLSGTSMACPHVSGAAALLLQTWPGLTPERVAQHLISNATLEALYGVPSSGYNRLLYTGHEPPMTTVTTTTMPVEFHGQMWAVLVGACMLDEKGCLTSPNYPGSYPLNDFCQIVVNASSAVEIEVAAFSTERNYDYVNINGRRYSGDVDSGDVGPEAVVPSGMLEWSSDYSATDKGWRLCPSGWDSSDPTSSTTLTTTTTSSSMTSTSTAPIAGDTRLAAYWDNGECGPHGDNYHFQWCNNWTSVCEPTVAVSSDLCHSGVAVFVEMQRFVSMQGCFYAYYARYECSSESTTVTVSTTAAATTTTTSLSTTTTTTATTTTSSSTTTPDAGALVAYWDLATCGPYGDDHHWEWCGRGDARCQQLVQVPTDVCADGVATLADVEQFVKKGDCVYAYHARYTCGSA